MKFPNLTGFQNLLGLNRQAICIKLYLKAENLSNNKRNVVFETQAVEKIKKQSSQPVRFKNHYLKTRIHFKNKNITLNEIKICM